MTKEIEGDVYRLMYRYTKEPIYEIPVDGHGDRLQITQTRWDHWSKKEVTRTYPAPAVLVGHKDIPDAEWRQHRNKTYSKLGPAKQARTYHYGKEGKGRGGWNSQYGVETKIVKLHVVTVEEEVDL